MFNLCFSQYVFAIPFFNEKFDVVVEISDSPELQQYIQTFAKDQQKNNQQLSKTDDKNRYAKLLSAILRKKMKSLGYYNFGLSLAHTKNSITFFLQPGQRAMIESIKVLQPDFIFENLKDIASGPAFQVGDPLLALSVLDAMDRLKTHINENYCFVAPQFSQSITLNTQNQQAHVFFNLETEQGKAIRHVRFTGNTSIKSDFLLNTVQLTKQCYKISNIRKAQTALLQTGLVTSATPEVIAIDDQMVDVVFQISERKHRTQSVGVGYSTEEGIRLNAGWEHRNWRGNSKKLTADFEISQLTSQLNGDLRIPQFKIPKLDLLLQNELSKTNSDAFDSLNAQVSVLLEYTFNSLWLGSLGVSNQYSNIESQNQIETFRLLSFPVSLRRDSSNSLLDPTKGTIWAVTFQPYIDMINTKTQFTQLTSSLRWYYSPHLFEINSKEQKAATLATRVAAGSIQGEPIAGVPADQRYYVGGGGSVRGFDYQSLSPQTNGALSGGLSFVEAAVELRLRFNPRWGASLFIDGGSSSLDQIPNVDQRLSLGGGIGVRYITSFAPIRVDIAYPLSSPNDFKTKAQLYVGLKQSF